MLDGKDLLGLNDRELRHHRSRIQMIFQDPFSSLDPKMTVGNIIGEAVKFHRRGEDVERIVLDYMEITGLRKEYYKRYPHEFSGGQRQRIGIARALVASIPVPDPGARKEAVILSGEIPSPMDAPDGCKFRTRCACRSGICETERPRLEEIGPGHAVACHNWKKSAGPGS